MRARQIIHRDSSHEHALPDSMHPVLRRIYSARNITSMAELDTSLSRLLPYQALLGIEQAVLLLFAAIKDRKRILIVADYDADGATGCALAIRGLQAMGATDVQYLVPSRFEFGYGLSPEIVEVAARYRRDCLLMSVAGLMAFPHTRTS